MADSPRYSSPSGSHGPSPEHSLSMSSPRAGAGSEAAMAELISVIDDGTLNDAQASSLARRGASLRQGLAYAMTCNRISAVIALADGCGARLEDNPLALAARELFELASRRDWPAVAYQVAVVAAAGDDALGELLRARDLDVQRRLRGCAREVRVQIPRDIRATFHRTGSIPDALHIESKRWLLPRPSVEQSYVATDGSKLEDGWYTVVQYPLADDLKEALVRHKYWESYTQQEVAALLRSTGETLLCKAVKDGQWKVVHWFLDKLVSDQLSLSGQLGMEFVTLWDVACERRAWLQKKEDLGQLCACLDNDAVLMRHWRSGSLEVPEGARVLWPRLQALRDALALGPLALEALRMIDGAQVTFRLEQGDAKREAWRMDLANIGESSFGLPLLHRAASIGELALMTKLLRAMVDIEAQDARGFTALAAAAAARHWDAVDLLLKEGCRASGPSGLRAATELRRAARPVAGQQIPPEQVAVVTDLLERVMERKERAPAATLAEYFLRQARGEIVHGIEPRSYELADGKLRSRTLPLRITTRALVLDGVAPDHEIRFVALDAAAAASVASVGILDLARRPLYSEQLLLRKPLPEVAPVSIPRARLSAPGKDGTEAIRAATTGPLAASLPALARAPPAGGLRVESVTCCCRESMGRVEIRVDGVRVGETLQPAPGSSISEELNLQLPAREMEIVAALCGRRLKSERLVGSPEAELCIEVNISIFVYVQMVDEEEQLEFLFTCGHRKDVPEDAYPFVGTVSWDGGSQRLKSFETVVLGDADCLAHLQSMRLQPELAEGRRYESVEWEDTGTEGQRVCQFQRVLVNPVRIGKICKASALGSEAAFDTTAALDTAALAVEAAAAPLDPAPALVAATPPLGPAAS